MSRLDLRRFLYDRDVLGLMGLGLLVKPVGVVTQMLLARWFGAGREVDAFQLAFFLVTFGDGMLTRVFKGAMAPHLIQRLQTMRSRSYAAYQNAVVGLFVASAAIWLAMLVILAGPLIGVAWPGLPRETADLTLRMLTMMALPGMLLVTNKLGMAVLQLHQRFRVPGAMPVLNAACLLAGLVIWHDELGIWSMPAGFALSQVVQWPLVYGRAFTADVIRRVRPSLADIDLRHVRDLVGLMAVSELLLTVNLFLDKWFATGLEPGSISSLHYGYTVINAVLVLFATSLITVMFPRMSAAIAAGDLGGCSADVRANLKRTTHLVVPGALALAVASPEIVRVLFQRGAFDAADAVRTSGTLTMYVVGLPALVINGLVARIFHSLQLLRDKVWLSVQFLATNLALNLVLVDPMAVRGLALASSLAINAHLLISLLVLHRRRSGLTTGRFAGIVAQSYALGAAAWLVYSSMPIEAWVAPLRPDTLWGALVAGGAKGALVGALYGGMLLGWRLGRR